MASNTLNDRSDGETITKEFFNDIHQALNGDLVGRNSSGVPTASQNLGTAAIPWGTIRAGGLVIGGSSIDTSQIITPTHRVTAGATRATSNQPAFLVPAGAGNGNTGTIDGTPTSLVFSVAGSSFTLSADLSLTGLTTAPSTNNTALVNDSDAADQASTRTWGEPDAEKISITIDTAGSEITSRVGEYAAFSINNGTETEYFTAFIASSTELTDCKRGYFYDESLAPINRIVFTNNDTITLMSLGYVFLDQDLTTTDVTYTEPQYQNEAPSSPATGDYWFDIPNALWKRYDGAVFQTVNRTLVGWIVIDDTDAVSARSIDFDARYARDLEMPVEISTTSIARVKNQYSMVNVAGQEIKYFTDRPVWNITTDLATSADMYNATEQASTFYFLYIDDEGKEIMSDIEPYRRQDLQGFYHPHNPWRMVGSAFNDASSDLQFATEDLEAKSISIQYIANSGQSFATATAATIDYEGARHETHAGLVTTGASWNMVAPAPGNYKVTYYHRWANAAVWAAGETHNAYARVNSTGTLTRVNFFEEIGAAAGSHVAWAGSNGSITLKRGDTVDIRAEQNSGSNLALQTGSADQDVTQVVITKIADRGDVA